MGPKIGGTSVNRLKINIKDKSNPILLMKLSGDEDYTQISEFSGMLDKIDLVQKDGFEGKGPYWAYSMTWKVEGATDDKYNGEYILEMSTSHRLIDGVLNVLAGAKDEFGLQSPVFYFSVYSKDGYPRIHFFKNGDRKSKFEWAYSIDQIPDRVNTGKFNAEGDPVYDYSPINKFWDDVFKNVVYPAVNRRAFTSQRDTAKVAKLKKNSEKMFADMTAADFPDAWKKLCDWMKAHLPAPEDQQEIKEVWEKQAMRLSVPGFLLTDGTISMTETAPANTDDDDSLPF